MSGYESRIAAIGQAGHILAHQILFHFSSAGISTIDQATLAALATALVFHDAMRSYGG